MAKKFQDWFDKNLTVGGMPTANGRYDLHANNVKIVINVSDEHNWQMANFAKNYEITYFWLPMHEYSTNYNIGLTSIYGALFVLFEAEKMNKKVYLHCHAGSNRSPTIQTAYYYMRTGKHLVVEKEINTDLEQMFIDTAKENSSFNPDVPVFSKKTYSNNRLVENVRSGMLPALPRMEAFLHECGIAFEKYLHNNGNYPAPSLDQIILNSQI